MFHVNKSNLRKQRIYFSKPYQNYRVIQWLALPSSYKVPGSDFLCGICMFSRFPPSVQTCMVAPYFKLPIGVNVHGCHEFRCTRGLPWVIWEWVYMCLTWLLEICVIFDWMKEPFQATYLDFCRQLCVCFQVGSLHKCVSWEVQSGLILWCKADALTNSFMIFDKIQIYWNMLNPVIFSNF